MEARTAFTYDCTQSAVSQIHSHSQELKEVISSVIAGVTCAAMIVQQHASRNGALESLQQVLMSTLQNGHKLFTDFCPQDWNHDVVKNLNETERTNAGAIDSSNQS